MVLSVHLLHIERQTHPHCGYTRQIRLIQWAKGKGAWLRMDVHPMHQYRIHVQVHACRS